MTDAAIGIIVSVNPLTINVNGIIESEPDLIVREELKERKVLCDLTPITGEELKIESDSQPLRKLYTDKYYPKQPIAVTLPSRLGIGKRVLVLRYNNQQEWYVMEVL